MMNSRTVVESLSPSALRSATWELVRRSHDLDAALLAHLGEIEERKLYLDWSFPSMFAYCVGEFGFSEDVACNRINVARAARRMPIIWGALRSGKVHLAGLRLLAPHLTAENQEKVLTEATGKSTRQIEALVARLAPQPPVPTIVRKLPDRTSVPESPTLSFGIADRSAPPGSPPALALVPPTSSAPRRDERRAPTPLSEDTFKFQFTATRACHDKFRQAQDLLRHRVPNGDVAAIFEKALDLLIEKVKKERFAAGRNPRAAPTEEAEASSSRHIPDAIKREVYERDGGRCTFCDEDGRRCGETGALEFDHLDGFARMHLHRADRIRLLCRAHNQHAAEKMYGRAFMERARASREPVPGSAPTDSGLTTGFGESA
jgi:5-methylcytosine-specific restriction endonuclease McrA